jgi:hypothetical protein
MVESTCFGVLLCGDITSDAVLGQSLDGISRCMETRLGASGRFLGFRQVVQKVLSILADDLFGIVRKTVV